MSYRDARRLACQKLFADFRPDFSGCRNPQRAADILSLAADGYFSHEIADKLGITPKAVQKLYRRYNFPTLHNFAPPLRENRRGWKGGVKEAKGYIYARTPNHPYASKYGQYVAMHRLVMEAKLGRYLLPGEVVDHIDGNPKNNAPDNLRVFESNAEHLRQTLAGKTPNWSQDGKRRLAAARTQPRRTWKGRRIEPNRAE